MMLVLNSLDAMSMETKGETFKNVSLTVPDQALTPQELLRRFATGRPLNVANNIYDSEHDFNLPELDKMDKLDRLHAVQENAINVKTLYADYNDLVKKADARKRNIEQAELAKRAKKQADLQSANNQGVN